MNKFANIAKNELIKCFTFFYALIVGLSLFLPVNIFTTYLVPIMGMQVVLSAIFAWLFYKKYKHTILIYDEKGFSIERGRTKIKHKWKKFRKITLGRTEKLDYFLRLYRKDDTYVDLPLTKFKINPFKFFVEIDRYMK